MSCSSRRIASNYLAHRGELIANPVVELSDDGTILSVESYEPHQLDRLESTEHYSGVMVAGMVNAHCHLELSYLRGVIPPHCGFAGFAAGMSTNRTLFSDQERLSAIYSADREMQRGGVVAVADILNGDSSYVVKSDSAIEYCNFAELFGLRSVDTSAIDGLLKYPSTYPTPHSLYSLNDEVLKDVVSIGDAPLSIHFMESEGEGELFHRRGVLYEWFERVGFECDFLHYDSPAHRLISLVPPERSVMLIHNCCVTQHDIDLIMNHFTAPVYWVICPRSNSYISGLKPPVDLLRRNNLTICVGTDSLASNSSLSLLDELKSIDSTATLAEQLMWVTANGASALSLPHLGDIEVGKRPGINIISPTGYTLRSIP
ncbi:MAG: amidohydrolase family protein [Rikenellaceae bacterium]